MLTATATSQLPIVLGAGVMIGVALACTSSGITANIAARVVAPHRRTLAFGLVSAAGSIGTMFTAPIAAHFLNTDGWRAGLWAFVIIALAMLPAAFIGSQGRPPAQQPRRRPQPHPRRRARRGAAAQAATS